MKVKLTKYNYFPIYNHSVSTVLSKQKLRCYQVDCIGHLIKCKECKLNSIENIYEGYPLLKLDIIKIRKV